MAAFEDKIISKHKAKKNLKKQTKKLTHLEENVNFNQTQIQEALLLKNKFRLSKKNKRKSREKASGIKRFQLTIESSSSECLDTLSPSRSEYQAFSTQRPNTHGHTKDTNKIFETENKTVKFNIKRFFRNYSDTSHRNHRPLSKSFLEVLTGKTFAVEDIEVFGKETKTAIQNELDQKEKLFNQYDTEYLDLPSDNTNEEVNLDSEGEDSSAFDEISHEEDIQIQQTSHSPDFMSSTIEVNKVKYIDLVDCKLVVLSGNVKVSLHGIVSVAVLYGKVEVLGHIFDKTSGKVNLYSPRGTSLLYMKNMGDNENEDSLLTSCLNKFDIDIKKLDIFPPTSVVHCTKLQKPFIAYIEKHISQQILPKRGDLLQCVFEPSDSKGEMNVINTSEQWDKHVDNIMPNTKMMICGGKGVGKSTLLRYAVNRLLHRFDRICVVDLDPGQSEFTVPGCLSIVTVKYPLLGPNYTHLQNTNCSVLSNINVGSNIKKYLNAIKLLMSKYKIPKGVPTLINYMGFHRGIGFGIASAAICIVEPTDVLMIQSQKSKNNFKTILSQPVVENEAKLFLENVEISPYNVIIMHSMTDENDGWNLVPRQIREMCLLAYLGKIKQELYEISLSDIKLVDAEGSEVPPQAFPANIVTLCSTMCDGEFIVLGWGIVRCGDLTKNVLVLQTPLEANILEEVHYLVVGNVTMPPSILMTTDDVDGLIPCIQEGDMIGQFTRRSYLPPNKK